jgi:hypothetical protein
LQLGSIKDDVAYDDGLLLAGLVTNDGIVDCNSLQIVIICVVGCDECIRNVWNIISGF